MTVTQWMAFFRRHAAKKLFSLSDLRQLTATGDRALQVELSRLTGRGLVTRLSKGWYANPFNPPSAEEVAMVLRFPSYLSMEYALFKHGVLSQTVFTLTAVTTGYPGSFTVQNTVVEYHRISKNLFWGYETCDGVNLACPEKALLDLVYIRRSKGRFSWEDVFSLLDDMYIEDLDREKLTAYMQRFGRFSPRLEQVLEEAGAL
ncbi:MAG: hypothetical protein D9V47_09615 [Clostridia bacterium]|nr:MAG: hypothetical protein D9V47_09615 [Clostridia bacterium]